VKHRDSKGGAAGSVHDVLPRAHAGIDCFAGYLEALTPEDGWRGVPCLECRNRLAGKRAAAGLLPSRGAGGGVAGISEAAHNDYDKRSLEEQAL
jgi:hypothetical protein